MKKISIVLLLGTIIFYAFSYRLTEDDLIKHVTSKAENYYETRFKHDEAKSTPFNKHQGAIDFHSNVKIHQVKELNNKLVVLYSYPTPTAEEAYNVEIYGKNLLTGRYTPIENTIFLDRKYYKKTVAGSLWQEDIHYLFLGGSTSNLTIIYGINPNKGGKLQFAISHDKNGERNIEKYQTGLLEDDTFVYTLTDLDVDDRIFLDSFEIINN